MGPSGNLFDCGRCHFHGMSSLLAVCSPLLQFSLSYANLKGIIVIVSNCRSCVTNSSNRIAYVGQVVPDPGRKFSLCKYWFLRFANLRAAKCREGVLQLLTMGVLDAATDVLLVVFPIPAIIYSKMQRKRYIVFQNLLLINR